MTARSRIPPVGTEALDSRSLDASVARTTLTDLALTNTLFGGRAAVLNGVQRLLEHAPSDRTFSVLDVGAGMGDVVSYIVRRSSGRHPTLLPITLDHHRTAARLCADLGLRAVVADTRALPFADRSIDIVVASLLLHHFTRAAAVNLVQELDRVARWGVVVADLRRSGVAAASLWVASFALRFHPATRHDGVVSIKRGFTRGELAQLLARAGAAATVRHRPWWRLVATWRTPYADS